MRFGRGLPAPMLVLPGFLRIASWLRVERGVDCDGGVACGVGGDSKESDGRFFIGVSRTDEGDERAPLGDEEVLINLDVTGWGAGPLDTDDMLRLPSLWVVAVIVDTWGGIAVGWFVVWKGGDGRGCF